MPPAQRLGQLGQRALLGAAPAAAASTAQGTEGKGPPGHPERNSARPERATPLSVPHAVQDCEYASQDSNIAAPSQTPEDATVTAPRRPGICVH